MSDRSKKMLALARANKQLVERFQSTSKRKSSQDFNEKENSEDPDYEPNEDRLLNKKKFCPTNKVIAIKSSHEEYKGHVRRLFDLPAKVDTIPQNITENTVALSEPVLPANEPATEKNYEQNSQESRTINIVSNVLICAAGTGLSVEDIARELINDIIDKAIKNVEKEKQKMYTKKGDIRKRRKFETTLSERKNKKHKDRISKFVLRDTCAGGCVRKCAEVINKERQINIHSQYWKLTQAQQHQFIFSAAKKTQKKKKCVGENSRRNNTIKYYLKDEEGVDFQVCKKFFLGTLGYQGKNDRIIRDVLSKNSSEELTVKPIKKGHPSEKKVDRSVILEHIKSFNPTISHYRREHAPNRLYLPSDINIKSMYEDFLVKHSEFKISYELYRQEVKNMNISFAVLGNEECWQCESFENHTRDSQHTKENIVLDCEQCKKWHEHNKNVILARQEYKKDVLLSNTSEPTSVFVSVDLQKVIMLPRCDMFKEIIFVPRIICFNESFVPLGKQTNIKKPVAIIWHEATAGRSQGDIISTFNKFFLLNRDAIEITLWMDNCGAQNKNWTLYSFLIYFINSEQTSVKQIKLKYLQSGHTFMSADAFHHQVEKSLKQKGKVLDFEDYKNCVQLSNSGRNSCLEMNLHDFLNVRDFSSRFKLNKTEPKPYLSNICELTFVRGCRTLLYRTNFESALIELDFLTAKALKEGVPEPERKTIPRGISIARKQNLIQKLTAMGISKGRLLFWQSLPENQEETNLDD